MNLSLTPQLEIFIRECAESSDYNNASEVVPTQYTYYTTTTHNAALILAVLQSYYT